MNHHGSGRFARRACLPASAHPLKGSVDSRGHASYPGPDFGPRYHTLRGNFVKAQFSPNFEKAGGLITAVTVDAANGDVLMVAYMNPEAFQLTLDTGKVHYWSRTRSKLWKKGESSGNMQDLVEMRVDCDLDAVVVRVRQTGPACHEGYRSCFFRTVDEKGELKLNDERIMTPEEIYGAKS